MRKNLLGLAIAAAFVFGIASTPVVARAATLPEVTQNNLDSDVLSGTKVSVLVVVGKNCKSCAGVEDAAAKSAAWNPNINVVKVDQDLLVMDDEDLPAFRVFVPGQGYIGTKKNVDVAAVDAFLYARANYAAKRANAQAAAAVQQANLDRDRAPWQKKAEDLLTRATAALGADYKDLQDADKAVRAAKTSIEAESAQKKADGLRDAFNTKAKPYFEEFKQLSTQGEAALAADQKAVDDAKKAVDRLDDAERQNILP